MVKGMLAGMGLSLTVLAGCGLAGTGGGAATEAAVASQQAAAATQQLDKVRADLDAAQKSAADMRAAGEAASQ